MERNIVAGHYDRQPYTQSLPAYYLVILVPSIGYIPGVHFFRLFLQVCFTAIYHQCVHNKIFCNKPLKFDALGIPKKQRSVLASFTPLICAHGSDFFGGWSLAWIFL